MKTSKAILFLVTALLTGLTACSNRHDHEIESRYYNAEVHTAAATYRAEIDDTDDGGGFWRIAHLYPSKGDHYAHITGHDNNFDGVWDRVFYCGNHPLVGYATFEGAPSNFGCNSVVRQKDGSWQFEPCGFDENRIQPFSEEAINFAIGELDEAMRQVHNSEHLVRLQAWHPAEKKIVTVFEKKATS